MDIILLRLLLLLLFSLQTVKEDMSIENKIQHFILLDYVKGVRFFGNPVFESFKAGFKFLSCLGEYLSSVEIFSGSLHILLEMREQLNVNNLYQMLVRVGYLFKYSSQAISKDFCRVPESGVHFLSQKNCILVILTPLVREDFFSLNFYSYFSFTNLVLLFYFT